MASTFIKDSASTLDYRFDWAAWMETGDTISAAAVTVPAGLTETAETFDDTSVTVWVSGGTTGTDYQVTCQITTTAGRVDERTITLRVRER